MLALVTVLVVLVGLEARHSRSCCCIMVCCQPILGCVFMMSLRHEGILLRSLAIRRDR